MKSFILISILSALCYVASAQCGPYKLDGLCPSDSLQVAMAGFPGILTVHGASGAQTIDWNTTFGFNQQTTTRGATGIDTTLYQLEGAPYYAIITDTSGCVAYSDTLDVNPGYNFISLSIFRCNTYNFHGHIFSPPAFYIDTLPCASVNHFDSLIVLNLSIDSALFTLQPSSTPHLWYIVNQSLGLGDFTYNWNWGDGTTSIGDTPSHTYDTAGYYTVCVTITDSSGCTASYCDSSVYLFKDQSAQMVYIRVLPSDSAIPTGIVEISSNQFVISPNPTNSAFSITDNTQSTSRNLTVQILSMLGQPVKSFTMTANGQNFDISDLPSGIYSVQVNNEKVLKIAKD